MSKRNMYISFLTVTSILIASASQTVLWLTQLTSQVTVISMTNVSVISPGYYPTTPTFKLKPLTTPN